MADQVFVAREQELDRLSRFLDQVLAGHGQVVFITGEAGAGKSTLVAEFARRAQAAQPDLLVAVGQGDAQTGAGDPYLPFREVLGLLTGDVDAKLAQGAITQENAGRLREFFRVSGQALVDLGPDLIDILVPGAGLVTRAGTLLAGKVGWLDNLENLTQRKAAAEGAGAASGAGQGLDQSHIFEQYTNVVQALAKEQPLILVVDDLQWADAASIDLLFRLGRRIGDSRILLLGTYRPADVALGRDGAAPPRQALRRPQDGAGSGGGQAHPLEDVISEFKRYFGDITVDLGHDDTSAGREFVDALLDTEPNRLGEDFRQALFQHTGGHPLFTVELLREMQARGDPATGSGQGLVRDEAGVWTEGPALDWQALPARVEGVIEKRVARLDPELHAALTTASVEGEQFTAEVVAQVQGVAARELVRRLSQEVDKQHRLVFAQGTQRLGSQRLSRYQFRHSIIQKYLYNSLDEVERAYLHEDVGNTLEDLCGGQPEALEAYLERLAYHFFRADLWSKAFEYAQRAGEKALALYAPHAAVEQFTRALEAAAQLSLEPPPALYRRRGQAFDTLGDFDQARADYEAALAAAQAAGDEHTAWQASLDLGLLWASRDYTRTGDYCRQALDLARSMADPAAIGHSLNRLGNWLMNTGQPHEALDHHREALDLFETLGDRAGIAATLDLLAMTSNMCGDAPATVRYYERAIPILRQLNDRQTLASSLTMLSNYTLDEALVREALDVAREINWRAGEAFALTYVGIVRAVRGDYGRGLRTVEAGLEVAEAIDHRLWRAAGSINVGMIYLELLQLEEAYRRLVPGRNIAVEVGSRFMTNYATGFLASTCLGLGRPDEAAALLPERMPESAVVSDAFLLNGIAELALARQDPARALELLDGSEVLAPANWLGAMAYYFGSTIQLRAASLLRLNRLDEAAAELEAVLDRYQEQGVRMGLWRVHLLLGKAYRARGERDRAEAAFAAARAVVEELAATLADDEPLQNDFRRQALDRIP